MTKSSKTPIAIAAALAVAVGLTGTSANAGMMSGLKMGLGASGGVSSAVVKVYSSRETRMKRLLELKKRHWEKEAQAASKTKKKRKDRRRR